MASTPAAGERPSREALLARAKSLSAEGFHVEAAGWLVEHTGGLTENERRDLYPVIAGYYHDAKITPKWATANCRRSA